MYLKTCFSPVNPKDTNYVTSSRPDWLVFPFVTRHAMRKRSDNKGKDKRRDKRIKEGQKK